MWNCDILQYIVLDQAIKNGNVGIMEDMLPHFFLVAEMESMQARSLNFFKPYTGSYQLK